MAENVASIGGIPCIQAFAAQDFDATFTFNELSDHGVSRIKKEEKRKKTVSRDTLKLRNERSY